LSAVNLEVGEEPLVLSFSDENWWLLLTNKKIAWKTNNPLSWLWYKDFKTASIDTEKILTLGASFKKYTKSLKLFSKSNEEFTVELAEAGEALFVLLNTLLWIPNAKLQ